MSEEIVVHTEVVQLAADDMATATTAMAEALQELEARLRPLEVHWTGSASEAFQSAQAAWRTTMREAVELLGALSGSVEQAGRAYQSTEDGVRAAWA